jgi:Mg-chelatase subunit ChlD
VRRAVCLISISLLALLPAGAARAQVACQVVSERLSRGLEYRPLPWGSEVDITPTFTVVCPGTVRPDRLMVTESLPGDVQRVPGVGRAPDRVRGNRLSWDLDRQALGATGQVSFTYRLYVTPQPARLVVSPELRIDWPTFLELEVGGATEVPAGPATDPLVVQGRPGARDCERTVTHATTPESVLPGEPFTATVGVHIERCRMPGPRHRAAILVEPATDPTVAAVLDDAAVALMAGFTDRDAGQKPMAGLVVNAARGIETMWPTVDRSALVRALSRLEAVQPGDPAAGLAAAVAMVPDWPEHQEVVYVLTHAGAPPVDAGAWRAAVAGASAQGIEVVPICLGGNCDPNIAIAHTVPNLATVRRDVRAVPPAHWGAPLDFRGATLIEALPPHIVLEPGSVDPPAAISSAGLEWSGLSVPVNGDLTFRYRAHIETWGRFPLGAPGYLVHQAPSGETLTPELLLPGFVTVRRDPAFERQPCRLTVSKTADPPQVPLGDPVTVTLGVNPYCQYVQERLNVVVSLDRSGSMARGPIEFSYVKLAAKALAALLAVDGVSERQFGLVAHDDPPVLELPLTTDGAWIGDRLDRMYARGQDNLAASIEMAAQVLRDGRPAGPDQPAEVLVILSDGGQTYPPESAIAPALAAQADGITVVAVCARTSENHCDVVRQLASNPSYYFEAESIHKILEAFVDLGIRLRQMPPGTATVTDDLAPNMRYLQGSASPPADEVGGQRLVWRNVPMPQLGARLTYQAVPLLQGTQPTNAHAVVEHVDALGNLQRQAFPVPEVTTVLAPGASHCAAVVRHAAERTSVTVGDPVTLTMTLQSDCPPISQPIDAVLVLDKSESMILGARMDNARRAVGAFLDSLDPSVARVGLVTFARQVELTIPPTADFRVIRSAVQAVRPGGITFIDLGLEAALRMLDGSPRDANRLVVLLTDGITHGTLDSMIDAANGIRASGAMLATVCAGDCDPVLPSLASRPDLHFQVDESARLVDVYTNLNRTVWRAYPHDVDLRAYFSPLVEPLPGSFRPSPDAMFSKRGDATWWFNDLPGGVLTATYQVRPIIPGRVPVALAYVTYAYGTMPGRDRAAFPVPVLDVTGGPAPTATPSYGPTATLTWPPTPTPTAAPPAITGRTVWLPAAGRDG